MRRSMAAAAAIAAIGAIIGPVCASVPATVLTSARIEHRGPTLELHFSFKGTAPRLALSSHGTELWIELGATRLAIPPRPLFGYETPPIVSVRATQSEGHSKIVVEVLSKSDYAIARLRDQNEIVLRVAASGADPNIAAPILVRRTLARRPTPPPVAEPVAFAPAETPRPVPVAPLIAPAPAVAREDNRPPGNFLVMIDPGHGGYDPGTQSSSGAMEKDLALQIAMRLKAALEARGIRAELTRSSDVFISLAERTQIANRAGADLFISIHLNSSPNTDTTGIEVYYLNNTTDRATIRLAKMENGAAGYGTRDDSNLNYILTDLRQNYKASEAASLARMIDAQAVADLDAGLGRNVNALGAKMGPFYVLVGAHMPAVLVECGFMSNAGEAAQLQSPQYQDVLAGAIAGAVAHYFNADAAVGNL